MEIVNHECYVSLEVAKLLKKAGFDWKCCGIYVLDSENDPEYVFSTANFTNTSKEIEGYIRLSAPTLDVAQRWLREVKSIEAVPWRWPTKVGFVDEYKPWSYKIVIYKNLEEVDIDDFNASGEDYFKTYEEAQESGIKKALELILEKGE